MVISIFQIKHSFRMDGEVMPFLHSQTPLHPENLNNSSADLIPTKSISVGVYLLLIGNNHQIIHPLQYLLPSSAPSIVKQAIWLAKLDFP